MRDACRNCPEPAAQRFCPACGQRTDDLRRPLAGLARVIWAI